MGLIVYHLSDYFDASISSMGGAVFVRPNTPRADFWTHGRGLTIGRMISDPGQVLLLIRPENAWLGTIQELPAENTWPVTVEVAACFGGHRQYILRDGNVTIRAKIGANAIFKRGDSLAVHIPPERIVVVEKKTCQSLC